MERQRSVLLVVTTCNPCYGKPWVFASLGFLSCRVACLLDPADRRPLPVNCERRDYLTPGVLYQDGRFLDALPDVADDEVVVLADADGVFQRDFSPDELDVLSSLSGGFALGYNLRPGQRGWEECKLLRLKCDMDGLSAALHLPESVLSGCWVYNTGFMAAKASSWRRLRESFGRMFGSVDGSELFHLHSWPQYFICMLFCLHGVSVVELDYSTHSHGHFQLTPKHSIAGRRLYYDNRLVLYAHNVPGCSH